MNSEAFESPALLPPALLPAALQFTPGTTVFYLSSHGYTSQHGDTPADTHFEGRLRSPFRFGRSILDGQSLSGRANLALGAVEIWNGDGFLDGLLRNYAIDGRSAVFKRGTRGTAYAAFSTLATVMAAGWTPDRAMPKLKLADMLYRLNVPLMTTLYGGGGGTDGTTALANLPKPVCLGQVQNVTPVLVDPINMIYQVHWRAVQSIYAVRENGAPIAPVVSSPGLGQWAPDNGNGRFQLGYKPSGTIACDVQGDAGGSGWDGSVAGILTKLLKEHGAGLSDADLDLTAFAQLAYDVPGVCGWYQGAEVTTVAAALDAIVAGIVGYVGTNRSNQISPGIIKSPSTTPAFTLQEWDILDLAELEPPAGFFPPPQRIRVGWGRNWSPTNLLAGSITDDTRAKLQAPFYGTASAFSNGVAAAYLASQDPPVFGSILLDQTAGQARATQLLDLFAPAATSVRRFFKAVTGRYLGQIELGYTGQLFHRDFGLTNGWLGTVVAWEEDAAAGTVTITLVG